MRAWVAQSLRLPGGNAHEHPCEHALKIKRDRGPWRSAGEFQAGGAAELGRGAGVVGKSWLAGAMAPEEQCMDGSWGPRYGLFF